MWKQLDACRRGTAGGCRGLNHSSGQPCGSFVWPLRVASVRWSGQDWLTARNRRQKVTAQPKLLLPWLGDAEMGESSFSKQTQSHLQPKTLGETRCVKAPSRNMMN